YNGAKYSFLRYPFFKIKKMNRRSDGWYGQVQGDAANEVRIKFYTLHFQGYLTKSLIPFYLSTHNALEYFLNYVSGITTFVWRKTLLFKTHIKDEARKYLHK